MMTNGWLTVELGEVLTRVKSELTIDDSVTYKQVTVRLWNKGVVLRGEQEGSAIKTKRQFYVKTGQLVMSRIDVRNGAIGLVPKELDGAIVSNDFWVYDFDESQVYPEFLALYVKTPNFLEEVNRTSSGTTHRIRAEETPFLEIQIPLPPLTEQRRIVAHIESLAARVNEAQRLREEADYEVDAFWKSSLSSVFVPNPNLQNTVEYACEAIIDNLHATPRYDGNEFLCVRSQDIGWGTLNYSTMLKTSKEEFQERIRRGEPQKGDIVFVREGDIGRCAVLDGLQRLSLGQRVMMLRPDTKKILSNYMMYQLMSEHVLDAQLLEGKKGTTSYHLNISHFRKVKINVPPLDEQRRIVAYLDGLHAKVNALREVQVTGGEELSALMPSVLDRAFKGEL